MNAERKVAKKEAAEKIRNARRARIKTALDSCAIKNDRELLVALKMSDGDAAMFLGKSRQALNNKLGPQTEHNGDILFDYFGIGEIIVMFTAASKLGRDLPPEHVAAIADYVTITRKPSPEDWKANQAAAKAASGAFELFEQVIEESAGFNTGRLHNAEVTGIVVVMRDVDAMTKNYGPETDALKGLVLDLKQRNPDAIIAVISATEVKTKALGRWLGKGSVQVRVTNQVSDHYAPVCLIYRDGESLPLALTVIPKTGLVEAVSYRVPDMSSCVLSMLPDDIVDSIAEDAASAQDVA